jgi:dihydroorotase-like cyclic amidohydrolase
MFESEFNRATRRLHLRYSGFWTTEFARKVKGQLANLLQQAAAGGQPFTVLDDLRDFSIQSPEVVEINKEYADLYAHYPISRNAMIVPGALARAQVQRTLEFLDNCKVFADYQEADAWLREVE